MSPRYGRAGWRSDRSPDGPDGDEGTDGDAQNDRKWAPGSISSDAGDALARELAVAGLPVDHLGAPDRQCFRFEDDAGTIGGIEGIGSDRLLRSVVVVPA